MPREIKTITFGGVNCYLVKTGAGYLLIDTGFTKNRGEIEKALESSGCHPGQLKLILITHGDYDHTGNASYLRQKYGAKIAMHPGDSVMVERGDMLADRRLNFFLRIIARMLLSIPPFRVKKADRFRPDLIVEDGWDLSPYGFEAKAVHIPGHSSGSLGILTAGGDLYCGDLYVNIKRPGFSSVFVERPVAKNSAAKLHKMNVKMVYPGHGQPFRWE
jgi:hydroxyacylglutathione hydrolase